MCDSIADDEANSVHPDDDIITLAPSLPPIPPYSGSRSSNLPPPPPPQAKPTMVVDHTDLNTPGNAHIVGMLSNLKLISFYFSIGWRI